MDEILLCTCVTLDGDYTDEESTSAQDDDEECEFYALED